MQKTIFALATGNQIAALSVIRVSGEDSERILKKKQVKEEKSTNIVVIQFVNAANSKKKLIFSYSKVDVETAK